MPGVAGPADDRALGRARSGGSDRHRAEIALAFKDAYRMLHQRIAIFTALPIRSLDQLSLQRRLDEIGQQGGRPPRLRR